MARPNPKKNGITNGTTSVTTNSDSVSKNISTNTGTAITSQTTTGTIKAATTTGNNRKKITNSNTQVVSTNTASQTVVQPQPKKTTDNIIRTAFGTPTVTKNEPYAKTQNRKFLTNSQSQISKSEQPANKVQPVQFTYAQDKSGNTYVIQSQLSLQQRQDLKNQGFSTSSIPFVTTGFASVPTGLDPSGHVRFPETIDDKAIIVDENLANQNDLYYDLSETQGEEIIDPVDTIDDGFTPNQATEATEQSDEANDVQLEANILDDHQHITTDKADERYADGKTLTSQGDEPLDILINSQQPHTEQWMLQPNQDIVPTPTYDAFSNNGKNGKTGVLANGNGKTNGNGMKNGMANLEATLGKITGSKYFPMIVIGIIVLMVIGFLKPKGAAAAPAAPSKVFQFA